MAGLTGRAASDAMQHAKPTGEPCQSEEEERQRGRKGDEVGREEVEVEFQLRIIKALGMYKARTETARRREGAGEELLDSTLNTASCCSKGRPNCRREGGHLFCFFCLSF